MHKRISLPEVFMNTAILFSKRSTCIRKKVGAVLAKDGRIIGTGYNGVPKGVQHCEDFFRAYWAKKFSNETLRDTSRVNKGIDDWFHDWLKTKEFLDLHKAFSEKNELHAETNVIAYTSRNGISTARSEMYITLSPCTACAKLMIVAGVQAVYYLEEYDRSTDGIEFLKMNGVKCAKF